MRRAVLTVALLGLPLALLDRAGAQRAAEPVAFSHEGHVGRGVAIDDCKSCHVMAPDGNAAPPTSANPHQPCATAGCHEAEYFSRTPKICAVCHDEVDPSKKLAARYAERRRSEFGGEINHVSHARPQAGQGENSGCVTCHGDPYRKTRPPEGHAVCSTCHGKTAQPPMSTCGGCHQRGQQGGGARGKPSEWAVTARFQHETHGRDPRTSSETSCVGCHASIPRAQKTRDIAAPAMQSCDGCHDGKAAFKTTGFECKKCHAPDK